MTQQFKIPEEFKIAVFNFSGNVGKSNTTHFLLRPRIEGSVHVAVETVNSDVTESEGVILLKGRDFIAIQEEMQLNDRVIFDIGSSNAEEFLKGMSLYAGSIDDFDLFVIPATPDEKSKRDTITSVDTLIEMGVSANKIKVVFNRLPVDTEFDAAFGDLYSYLKTTKIKVPKHYIQESPFYATASKLGLTAEEIIADKTDYKALRRAEPDREKQLDYIAKLMTSRLAIAVKDRLDLVAKEVLSG